MSDEELLYKILNELIRLKADEKIINAIKERLEE
jgi:hypothetical protein